MVIYEALSEVQLVVLMALSLFQCSGWHSCVKASDGGEGSVTWAVLAASLLALAFSVTLSYRL